MKDHKLTCPPIRHQFYNLWSFFLHENWKQTKGQHVRMLLLYHLDVSMMYKPGNKTKTKKFAYSVSNQKIPLQTRKFRFKPDDFISNLFRSLQCNWILLSKPSRLYYNQSSFTDFPYGLLKWWNSLPAHVTGNDASLPIHSLHDQNYSKICIEEAHHPLNSIVFDSSGMIHCYQNVENQAIPDDRIRYLKWEQKNVCEMVATGNGKLKILIPIIAFDLFNY